MKTEKKSRTNFRTCDLTVAADRACMVRTGKFAGQSKIAGLVLPFCLLAPHPLQSQQPHPSAESIVAKVVAANQKRAQTLRGYRGKRFYHLDYHGFLGTHSAQMQVEVVYTAPDKKDFKVVSQSGSKVLINRVLLKLLDSEKEAFQPSNRKRMELNATNYELTFVDTEAGPHGNSYVLNVQPREKTKFLYSGKIWVNTSDYAVTRMEGEPAKNPSIWISRTKIEYIWNKVGGYWLPAHNQSITQVRLGGSAVLTIDYTDYQISALNGANAARGNDKSVLPDPASVTPDQH